MYVFIDIIHLYNTIQKYTFISISKRPGNIIISDNALVKDNFIVLCFGFRHNSSVFLILWNQCFYLLWLLQQQYSLYHHRSNRFKVNSHLVLSHAPCKQFGCHHCLVCPICMRNIWDWLIQIEILYWMVPQQLNHQDSHPVLVPTRFPSTINKYNWIVIST
jgi:hypothetical protein